MKYLHTMVRVGDLDASLYFYCNCLGMVEVRRNNYTDGRFTLCFLAAVDDVEQASNENAPLLELTWNWDGEQYQGGRNFGHLAFQVENIYATCQRLVDAGITINRPPRDGKMVFIRSPDNISIELLQKNEPLTIAEPCVHAEYRRMVNVPTILLNPIRHSRASEPSKIMFSLKRYGTHLFACACSYSRTLFVFPAFAE